MQRFETPGDDGKTKMAEIVHRSTKTYVHAIGLSAAFRQWRADSHCRFLHGYSLEVVLIFEASELDVRNWVVDFGSLKDIKKHLEDIFDHKTVVAGDDPELSTFMDLDEKGLIQLVVLEDGVGCEKYAEYIFRIVEQWMHYAGYAPRCWIKQVEVKEHGGNSAIVARKD